LSSASWTKIFSAFKVALDPKKLLLAAAGILTMAAGWWVLAVLFYLPYSTQPQWGNYEQPKNADRAAQEQAWVTFKEARRKWNLLHELAGPTSAKVPFDAADVADSLDEYEAIRTDLEALQGAKAKTPGELRLEIDKE